MFGAMFGQAPHKANATKEANKDPALSPEGPSAAMTPTLHHASAAVTPTLQDFAALVAGIRACAPGVVRYKKQSDKIKVVDFFLIPLSARDAVS